MKLITLQLVLIICSNSPSIQYNSPCGLWYYYRARVIFPVLRIEKGKVMDTSLARRKSFWRFLCMVLCLK